MNVQKLILLIVGTIIIFGVAIFYWRQNRNQSISQIQLADKPLIELNLSELDKSQSVKGKCFKDFQVNGIGQDDQGVQKYSLSILINQNPKDESELANFLATKDCSNELKIITQTIQTKLGLKSNSQSDLFSTSFKTKSGRRLFLP